MRQQRKQRLRGLARRLLLVVLPWMAISFGVAFAIARLILPNGPDPQAREQWRGALASFLGALLSAPAFVWLDRKTREEER